MKIGILTQPLHRNYGGILQNWALQQVLKGMGHQPVCINRKYDPLELTASVLSRRTLASTKHFLLKLLRLRKNTFVCAPWAKEFDLSQPLYCDKEFLKKIDSTERIFNDRQLRDLVEANHFDAFIVGSDQVWRQEYSPRIETYFFDFLSEEDKRPKIAYATSFGTSSPDIDPAKMDECRNLLYRFDAVSVREYSGLDILSKDFHREDAVKVLDPTMLLEKEDYLRLINNKERITGKFATAYILDKTDSKTELLQEISRETDLRFEELSGEYQGQRMHTVSQWLARFAEAEFIVTDSFHGCVFSVIFRKPFIAIANKDRGLDRFTSLLEPLGLADRLIEVNSPHKKVSDFLNTGIDYHTVYTKLRKEQEFSLKFLQDALT